MNFRIFYDTCAHQNRFQSKPCNLYPFSSYIASKLTKMPLYSEYESQDFLHLRSLLNDLQYGGVNSFQEDTMACQCRLSSSLNKLWCLAKHFFESFPAMFLGFYSQQIQ